jgi:hypothetical protein
MRDFSSSWHIYYPVAWPLKFLSILFQFAFKRYLRSLRRVVGFLSVQSVRLRRRLLAALVSS